MTTLPNKVSLNPTFLHQLEIMNAIAEGKQVQSKPKESLGLWVDYNPSTMYQSMNFLRYDFRIKPGEPRVFYVLLRADGTVVYTSTEEKKVQTSMRDNNADPYLTRLQPYTYIKVVEEIK